MFFANVNGFTTPYSLRKIRLDIHDNFAIYAMRASKFANNQKNRLARPGRACAFLRAIGY
jgi:hypothetical protein